MQQLASRLEAFEAARRWIIAQRDDAAKGILAAALMHMVLGAVVYLAGAAFVLFGAWRLLRNDQAAVALAVAAVLVTFATAVFAALFRRRRGIPFADGRIYPDEIDVDTESVSHERILLYWFFGVISFWIAGAFGRFARWITAQWIEDVRTIRSLMTLDTGVAAEMLEAGLDAVGAAPLIDLESIRGARARTLQALCALPGIILRGGRKPGLVVSGDARERIMLDLGWSR